MISHIVGNWSKPPESVPTNNVPDGPLLGNGDLGVTIGGPPHRQQFWLSKCDFWRPKPLFPWFTPALIGTVGVDIPALADASYHAQQSIFNAEVLQTFIATDSTVKMRSWTPATQNALVIELSCVGKPVEVDITPWTWPVNGATVVTGSEKGVHWLTRSFIGEEYDWQSQAALAVHADGMKWQAALSPGGAAVISQRRHLQIGREQYGAGRWGFAGKISDVQVFASALADRDIASWVAGHHATVKPVYRWASDDSGISDGKSDEGGKEKEHIFTGVADSFVDAGQVELPITASTIMARVLVDHFDSEANYVLSSGEWKSGISLGFHQGKLRATFAGEFVELDEDFPLKTWVTVAATFDGVSAVLFVDGRKKGESRSHAQSERFILSPEHPLQVFAAVVTNQETPDFQSAAIRSSLALTRPALDPLRQEHVAWWRKFWNESYVDFGDQILQNYYYGSFYIMACCSRNVHFAPPLFGNWASGDCPAMGGDYHMNYNHQAPWWGCFIANHISLTDAYDTPVLEFLERGKYMAQKYLGRKGIYYCVGIGPKGSATDWTGPHVKWLNDSADSHFFAGQKCNALFGGINMAMRWHYTEDPIYGAKVYPYLRELANFWEDDLVFESGRYSMVHDNIHEFSPVDGGETNNPMSLALLRTCLQATLDISRKLDLDSARREKWQHILDHLSDFTVFEHQGKKVFRYSEKGRDWAQINGVGLQHIYPADAIGLESSPELLTVARNTIDQTTQCWNCSNHTMSFYPGAARVGYDPERLLTGLRSLIEHYGHPNLWLERNGGGIETCSTVTTTIDEMLLQSHQGIIRLFADWPMDHDASFGHLRTYGAFLVSAELRHGVIGGVSIFSERGMPCEVCNPWPGKSVTLIRNAVKAETLSGRVLSFATAPTEVIRLSP